MAAIWRRPPSPCATATRPALPAIPRRFSLPLTHSPACLFCKPIPLPALPQGACTNRQTPPTPRPPPPPPPPPACRHHQVEDAIDDTADATKGAYRGAKGAAKDVKANAAAAGERVKDEGHGALSSLKHHTVGHSDRTPPLRAG